jgi:hypothetical protein
MPKSSIKPKASLIWSEQTEKLKQKLLVITGLDVYFDQGMELILQRLRDKVDSPNHEFEIATKL